MQALNKLQIRFIQSINGCTLSTTNEKTEAKKFDALYLLSSSSFYIANADNLSSDIAKDILGGKELVLTFKDKKKRLICRGTTTIIKRKDAEFTDASDFFTIKPSGINHIIEFVINEVVS